MVEKANNQRRINLMLLQESLWSLEDKLNVILESLADHEAELARLRNSRNLILQRLESLESRRKQKNIKEGRNGRR